MSNKSDAKVLVEEKVALSLFLDALLHEPETETLIETLEAEPAIEVVAKTQTIPDIDTEQQTETVTETKLQQDEEVELTTETSTEESLQTDSVVPSWANEPFQIMLFKVAGLSLAVPLDGLNGVVEWKDDLTEMPGHADFYLGVLQHLGSSIPVVDTARLVFPQDKLKELAADNPVDRITRIVLINDGRWGLACDDVAEVVTLTADQVRWRSDKTKRRWLLGTVVDHMCALLDTDAFAEKLVSGED